jgi:hypothetical protein
MACRIDVHFFWYLTWPSLCSPTCCICRGAQVSTRNFRDSSVHLSFPSKSSPAFCHLPNSLFLDSELLMLLDPQPVDGADRNCLLSRGSFCRFLSRNSLAPSPMFCLLCFLLTWTPRHHSEKLLEEKCLPQRPSNLMIAVSGSLEISGTTRARSAWPRQDLLGPCKNQQFGLGVGNQESSTPLPMFHGIHALILCHSASYHIGGKYLAVSGSCPEVQPWACSLAPLTWGLEEKCHTFESNQRVAWAS